LHRQILLASKGEKFESYFDEYIRPYFIKGVPSIFTEVEEIYNNKEKSEQIQKIVMDNMKSLEENNTFKG